MKKPPAKTKQRKGLFRSDCLYFSKLIVFVKSIY